MIPQVAFLIVKAENERREREYRLGGFEAELRAMEIEAAANRPEQPRFNLANALQTSAQAVIRNVGNSAQRSGLAFKGWQRQTTPDCTECC